MQIGKFIQPSTASSQTTGDIVVYDASVNGWTILAKGSAGQVLKSNGAAALPAFADISSIVTPYYTIGSDMTWGDTALTEQSLKNASWTKMKEIKILAPGTATYRIYWRYKGVLLSMAYSRIYKNGSPYGASQPGVYDSWTPVTEDLSFTQYDLVQLYLRCNDASYFAYCDNFKILCANTFQFGAAARAGSVTTLD